MTDETRLRALLQVALPPSTDEPTRDLWPEVTSDPRRTATWSWRDLGLAAAAALSALVIPNGWFWLAYHF